jgi:hypothetical protein
LSWHSVYSKGKCRKIWSIWFSFVPNAWDIGVDDIKLLQGPCTTAGTHIFIYLFNIYFVSSDVLISQVKLLFLTGYNCITWFGTVYAFHKLLHGLLSINCSKPGYIIYLFKNLTYSLSNSTETYLFINVIHFYLSI